MTNWIELPVSGQWINMDMLSMIDIDASGGVHLCQAVGGLLATSDEYRDKDADAILNWLRSQQPLPLLPMHIHIDGVSTDIVLADAIQRLTRHE